MITSKTRKTRAALAATLLTVLPLAACSGGGDKEATAADMSDETLATAISSASDLGTVTTGLSDLGFTTIFDGTGAYTVLAPDDEAFDKLGDMGEALRDPEQRAVLAAVLRDHIVPGYLLPEDIGTAIDASDDGTVEMQTMAGHTVSFARDGDAIRVTAADGSTARFDGNAVAATNGVAIPIDTVLKSFDEPS